MAVFTVELADGREVEVEANSPQEAARAAHVFQQRNPASQSQPNRRQALVPRTNSGALPWQQLRNQRSPQDTFQGGMESFNRGLPFSRDIGGVTVGAMRGGQEALRQIQTGDGNPFAIEAAARQGYEQQTQRAQDVQQQFAGDNPMAASLLEGTGIAASVAPTLMTGGATLPAQAQTQAPGLFGRMARGASTGSLYGYAYGAGGADQAGNSIMERMQAGNEGGAMGAAFGAAIPPALRTVEVANNRLARPAWEFAGRPVVDFLTGAARRLPTAERSTLGALGGNMRPPPAPPPRRPAPPPRPQIPEAGINTVNRMRARERMSIDDLEREFERARANPQGQVVVDLFDDTGVRTARPIVQGPGESSRRAQDVARSRFTAAPGQIMRAIREGFKVGESRVAALARLEGSYRRLSAEEYRPLFAQRPTPEQLAAYDERIAPLLSPDNPNPVEREIMQDALARAERQFHLDRAEGIVSGNLNDNLFRRLHYIKGALGDRAQFELNPLRGTSGREIASIRSMYRRFGELLDPPGAQPIIPGYRRVTDEAGDYFSAREALDEGAEMLRRNPEEVQARFGEMTQFERRHARIGLADAIRTSTRGGVNRNRNVAAVLDDPDIQATIAAAFDNPEQAAAFLSLMNGSGRGAPGLYRLMDNAAQWRSGSSTYANAMHGADEAMNAGMEAAGHAATGSPMRAVGRGIDYARNQLSLGMVERANNRRGEVLFRRIDDEEAKAFTDEIIRILREREASAAAQTALTNPAAAGTANIPRRDRR